MSVKLTKTPTNVCVSSPYHPDFAPAAKRIGGKWDSTRREWCFDVRDYDRVAELCRSIYGTDGTAATGVTITVRLTATDGHQKFGGGLYFAGRCLAYATGRDSGARLGDGVILLSGRARSGGSVKNWTTQIDSGSILEVRDLPAGALETADLTGWTVERVQEGEDRRAALEAERARLIARIAEIDAELAA